MSLSRASRYRFVDIGANLLDDMFFGRYNSKKYHAADLIPNVIDRAYNFGVKHILVTGTDLASSVAAVVLCELHNKKNIEGCKLHATIGIHPTQTSQLEGNYVGRMDFSVISELEAFFPGESHSIPSSLLQRCFQDLERDAYLSTMHELISLGTQLGIVKAIGECGLDYDRLHFSSKETQLHNFPIHFQWAEEFRLPMFLHNRNTGKDFSSILKENRHRIPGGVVHSFTDDEATLHDILECDVFVGLNGCSLKTVDNLTVAKAVPVEKLMLETDAPWCAIKSTHAGNQFVLSRLGGVKKEKFKIKNSEIVEAPPNGVDGLIKDRCEPCAIVQVAEVISAVKEVDMFEFTELVYQQSVSLFRLE